MKDFCANLNLVVLIKFVLITVCCQFNKLHLKSYPTYYPHIYREILLTRQAGNHSLSIFGQIVQCIVQLFSVHLWRSVIFACSKHLWIPYPDQLFLPMISFLVQTQHFCDSRLPKDQIWCSRSDKIVSHLLPSTWSVLLKHMYHLYVVMDYGFF